MEFALIALFCSFLALCVATDHSVLYAMCAGFALFFGYGLARGCGAQPLARAAWKGVRLVGPVIFIFLLIGMISAAWRASGTIPAIVSWAADAVEPRMAYLLAFWFNGLMSFLTGTSFGTVSIMGVVFMTIGHALGADPVAMAGAVMSGIFFGDRCSPVSSSAYFVATVTQTNLYDNLRRMAWTGAVPFAAASLIYLALGFAGSIGAAAVDVRSLFASEFNLSLWTLAPVAVLLVLTALRASMRLVLGASVIAALAVALAVQGRTPADLAGMLVFGFESSQAALAPMINGGGMLSMILVSCIAAISATFSGLFEATGILKPFSQLVQKLARTATPFGAMTATAALTGMISCNQILSVLLTNELCRPLFQNERRAIGLENTSIVTAALIPWSIASSVPVGILDAPASCLLFAFYLILLPVWSFAAQFLPAGRIKKALGV